jgi:5-hydroxyisourate hydrolase
MSGITTHVLDTARGRPAAGVFVRLEFQEFGSDDRWWFLMGEGKTDADGRLNTLLPPREKLRPGVYRLTFDTGAYFRAQRVEAFYPEAQVVFAVRDPAQHYHVPLLLSPYGYATYRGS